MENLLLVSLLCQENLLPFSLPGTALREKPHGGVPDGALHYSTCMECLPKAGERGNEVSIS